MNRIALSLLLCLLLGACADILEDDITGRGVILLTPPDNHQTSSNLIEFRWEAVPDAMRYRIQIADPDFQNPVRIVLDTLISATRLATSLSPGSYTWQVRGENPNSHTSYYMRLLTITESPTLAGLTPILSSPEAGVAIRNEPITFTWQELSGASDYRFELRTGSSSGALVQAQIVQATLYEADGIAEGTYAWGVQGQNATSSSAFAYRGIRIDRTPPSTPALLAPGQAASFPNAPFTFQWQSGVDALTSTADSLFVLDANLQSIRAIAASTTSITDSLGPGAYSWHVRTVDEAGNGTSSVARSFTVQ